MGDEMGTFRVTVEIENPVRSGERRTLESVLVDTGATAAARRHRPGSRAAATRRVSDSDDPRAIRSPDSASGWGWH